MDWSEGKGSRRIKDNCASGGSTKWEHHWASKVRKSGTCESLLEYNVIDDLLWIIFHDNDQLF